MLKGRGLFRVMLRFEIHLLSKNIWFDRTPNWIQYQPFRRNIVLLTAARALCLMHVFHEERLTPLGLTLLLYNRTVNYEGPQPGAFFINAWKQISYKSISQDLCQMQTCSIDRADWRIHVGIEVWDEWMICIQAEIHAIYRGKLSRSKSLLFMQLVFWLRLSILLTNSIYRRRFHAIHPLSMNLFEEIRGLRQ